MCAVPDKVKGGKRGRKEQQTARKPLSGLDVDALLREPANKRTKVEPDNAIPSFKQLLLTADDDAIVVEAGKQMGAVISDLVSESFGDLNFDQATENLKVFREEMINIEFPKIYDDFLRDFKKRLFTGALGGDRREFWFNNVRKPKLGLIDTTDSDVSRVTPEEAAEVSTGHNL